MNAAQTLLQRISLNTTCYEHKVSPTVLLIDLLISTFLSIIFYIDGMIVGGHLTNVHFFTSSRHLELLHNCALSYCTLFEEAESDCLAGPTAKLCCTTELKPSILIVEDRRIEGW